MIKLHNKFNANQNVAVISILLVILVDQILKSERAFVLSLSWVLFLLIMGNVRRLKRSNDFSYMIRMTLYFLPFIVPALIFMETGFFIDVKVLIAIPITFLIAAGLYFVNKSKWKYFFSDINISNTKKERKIIYFGEIYNSIGAAICEELYYRSFFLSIDRNHSFVWILLSSLFFVFNHYVLPWNSEYSKSDFATQFAIGFVNGLIFLVTKSIVPCIVLHILINSFGIIYTAKCYIRHYIKTDHYDKIARDSEAEMELDLEL